MSWNGAGQGPAQQPLPPQYPPPPPPRLKTTPVLLAAAGTTVIALIGAVAYFATSETKNDNVKPMTKGPAAAQQPAPVKTDPDGVAKPAKPLTSTIPGWLPVDAYRHGLAYDVPAGWQVKKPDTFVGFGDDNGKPLVIMTGVAGLEFNKCGVIRTGSFGGPKPDPNKPPMTADRAKNPIPKWANEIYPSSTKQKPIVKFVKTSQIDVDGVKGTHVRAEVTSVGKLRRCQSRHGVIDIVAFLSTNENPIAFLMYADTKLPGEVPAQDREKILQSLRLR